MIIPHRVPSPWPTWGLLSLGNVANVERLELRVGRTLDCTWAVPPDRNREFAQNMTPVIMSVASTGVLA